MSLQRESEENALERWARLYSLQKEYPTFTPFLQDAMYFLGFDTDEIQEDIGEFLETGPDKIMVQAQRSQAKSTITAIYACYELIHDPEAVVLIVSAGDRQANEISTLITRLIINWDILECLRPDRQAGDRTSVDKFDIHHSLKRVNKSPSVACMGITANLQGARSTLLIADDVESGKNSRTAVQRAQLLHITKDFSSIVQRGRIVYLGTPQTIESIYNTLPGRGFTVRIWPGRYPDADTRKEYGDALAPIIERVCIEQPERTTGYGLDGKQGEATSKRIVPEGALIAKEIDQGPAYFQLQHMLLTTLADKARYPLKTENLVSMRLASDVGPMTVTRSFEASIVAKVNERIYKMSPALSAGQDGTAPYSSTVLYVDPAGGGKNADETGWACVSLLNSNLFARGWGGVPGGYEPVQLQAVADLVVKYRPSLVKIEQNFGHGAYKAVVTPIIRAACEHAGVPMPAIDDDYVTGQKETRIIDVLEPIMGRGALVLCSDALEAEREALLKLDARERDTYSLLFQIAKITRESGALIHDDRVDALAGACAHYKDALAVDQKKAIEASEQRAYEEMMANPRSLRNPPKKAATNRFAPGASRAMGSMLSNRIRRI